jgi:hypothetical protein
VREVIGPTAAFETMFATLAGKLDVVIAPEPGLLEQLVERARGPSPVETEHPSLSSEDRRAQTLDDLLAAVVGVGDYGGQAVATGALIAEPRGILCDLFPLANVAPGEKVPVRTRTGEHWEAAVIRRLSDSPFGPVLLEVPDGWSPCPLSVDASPVSVGDIMRVAVFAGERPGVSSGAVAGVEYDLRIEPVGNVEGLVSLHLAVAPGSSGAPVVDASQRLRGFVVAGSQDLTHPESYMDPASRWHAALARAASPVRTRKRKRP